MNQYVALSRLALKSGNAPMPYLYVFRRIRSIFITRLSRNVAGVHGRHVPLCQRFGRDGSANLLRRRYFQHWGTPAPSLPHYDTGGRRHNVTYITRLPKNFNRYPGATCPVGTAIMLRLWHSLRKSWREQRTRIVANFQRVRVSLTKCLKLIFT